MHNAQSTAAPAPFSLCTPQTNPLLQQAPRIPPEKPSVPMVSEKFMSSKGPTCSLTPFKEIQSNSGEFLSVKEFFLASPYLWKLVSKSRNTFLQKSYIQFKIREYICTTTNCLCQKSKKQMFGQHQI